MIPRLAATALRRLLRSNAAVLITGPRQCGKTTLVATALASFTHVDLERAAELALVRADVDAWAEAHLDRVAIDEAQRAPELFPALRAALDQRTRTGGRPRLVLLGSASPTLLKTAGESLAGRLARLELTPFLAAETAGRRSAPDRWFWGGFPPVHARRSGRERSQWLDDYVSAVLERDLPALGFRLPATRLRTLLEMLTHVHGNVLNASDLARSLGASVPTVIRDLDVLEGVYLVRRLQPFHANIQKRLTKSPKIYLRDTGILHLLAGLRGPDELSVWSRRGASFEGLVIEELAALARERCVRPGIHYWRTDAGGEVDLLITDGQRIVPIEIKLGSALDLRSLKGLRQCMADLGAPRGYVVTGGGRRERLGTVELVPWDDVVSRRCTFGLGLTARS